jgi:hypothetical protein
MKGVEKFKFISPASNVNFRTYFLPKQGKAEDYAFSSIPPDESGKSIGNSSSMEYLPKNTGAMVVVVEVGKGRDPVLVLDWIFGNIDTSSKNVGGVAQVITNYYEKYCPVPYRVYTYSEDETAAAVRGAELVGYSFPKP